MFQQSSHVQTAELLANAHDHIFGLRSDRLEVLRGLQDSRKSHALGIDGLCEVFHNFRIVNRLLRGVDMIYSDRLNLLSVFVRVSSKGGIGGADQAVGGAFALGVRASSRADDGNAVALEACPVVFSMRSVYILQQVSVD